MARPTHLIVTALLLAAGGAPAADTDHGRALYEARCDRCHDSSVHGRNPRSARTFDQIRAFVARWDRELGTAWTVSDINAVARYLNDKYYHFPCPAEYCKAPQARLD
jgi:cytochrome c553